MAALNDEQVMLRDMAREWADNESPISAFRKLRDAAPAKGFDPEAWSTVGQMGWAGVVIPEEFGGSAFGAPETDPYVVEGGPGRGLGEVAAPARPLDLPPDGTDDGPAPGTGPLVPTGDEAAA